MHYIYIYIYTQYCRRIKLRAEQKAEKRVINFDMDITG